MLMLAGNSVQAVPWYMQITFHVVYHRPQVVIQCNAWPACVQEHMLECGPFAKFQLKKPLQTMLSIHGVCAYHISEGGFNTHVKLLGFIE